MPRDVIIKCSCCGQTKGERNHWLIGCIGRTQEDALTNVVILRSWKEEMSRQVGNVQGYFEVCPNAQCIAAEVRKILAADGEGKP